MIHYSFSQKNPASHYIYVDMVVDSVNSDKLHLHLPAWRPGRYELGNFAKNIKRVEVFNSKNEPVCFTKLKKDVWEIETKNCTSVKITYSYYASELNAGACFANESQVYVNPIHCCFFVSGRTQEEHQIELKIPENYTIATSLKIKNKTLVASNYDELVDSPFIASANIKSDFYEVNGIKFHLHFNGECEPNFNKIKTNFIAFTNKQIQFWGDFPYDVYHFIFQVLPVKFYHGVEHKKSTVIAIGPGYEINNGSTYKDILGVSCHELFHTWNIKTIRPIEMLNYDYTKENYSRTGYVYEGFTTYYGDKLLLSSSVFSLEFYFETLQERLTNHFHNFGRYNLSVADSSWDTWLDGYVPGAPYRKTNIYDEGCLIAFMLDVMIMKATDNKKCLRDVCLFLYARFGKTAKGYCEQTIIDLVNEVSGKDFTDFFKTYVYKPNDFEIPLLECFNYLGIEFIKLKNSMACENNFGFKVTDLPLSSKVNLVAPYSPAWKAGLFLGDEIIAVNNIMLKNNLNNWLNYFITHDEINLTVNSNEQLKTIILRKSEKIATWFFIPYLSSKKNTDLKTQQAFDCWKQL